MKNLLLLFTLFASGLYAQVDSLVGIYKNDRERESIRLNADNTFDVIKYSGSYRRDGNLVILNADRSFMLHKQQGNSQQLQLSFIGSKGMIWEASTPFIYVGYENEQGGVTYLHLYKEAKDQFANDTLHIEIPRTEKLYLVNSFAAEYHENNGEVTINTFYIGKNTNALEVVFLGENSALRNQFIGVYEASTGELSLMETGNKRPDIYQKLIPTPLYPNEITRVKNWEYLSFKEVKTNRKLGCIMDAYDDILEDYKEEEEEAKINATLVVSDSKNIEKAIQRVKPTQQLLAILHQPQNPKADKEFELLKLSYKIEKSDKLPFTYQFYTTSKGDEQWLKKHGIAADKNQIIFVDYEGHVLYYQKSTIAEAQRDDFFGKNTAPTLFNSIIVARHIDQLFANPQAPIKEVEALFYTYLKNYDLSLYLLTDRKKFEQEYYALDFKNKKLIYQLKTTPAQLTYQWRRVAASHQNDTVLDPLFARMTVRNLRNYQNYLIEDKKVAAKDKLQTIAYLMKFSQAIKAYNEAIDKDVNISSKKKIEPYDSTVQEAINDLEKEKVLPFEEIRPIYEEAVAKKMTSALGYIYYLLDRDKQAAIDYYIPYIEGVIAQGKGNFVQGINKVFPKNGYYSDWYSYGNVWANQANSIAYYIFETRHNDAALLSKATRWMEAICDFRENDPYYLDTYACLLYATNQKDKAIKIEEKAVQAAQEKDKKKLLDSLQKTLLQMKNGTL